MPITPGAIRFNTDSMKLEYYRGGPVGFGTTTTTGEWVNITTDSPDIQTGGARGVFAGGFVVSNTNVIQYITISTTGNAQNFGDLILAKRGVGACASSTRGIFGGGIGTPAILNTIDYITISSTGDAQDFGDLISELRQKTGLSSSTRGVLSGGYTTTPSITFTNSIEYITISSTGDAKDFGDLSDVRGGIGACSSSTRGVFCGGYTPAFKNIIEFITISTLGNVSDFGDLSAAKGIMGVCSNSVRGIIGGGSSPTALNVIEFITISTLGNSQDFGDLGASGRIHLSACSSSNRGVFGGGYSAPTEVNIINYVTIMSAGDAVDFGDLIQPTSQMSACSNGHGGIG